ncbi:hypothetical protein DH2020_022270 [Rehmannia glutinosa]|uniref:Reverse transcriptase Ty1/copia-type domain-containing protein n=1 Tax=Rehmannia glutinosa TaxID=99300 RepID=A0ABR0WH36_REHGL
MELCKQLLAFGMVQSASDHCLFTKKGQILFLHSSFMFDVLIIGSHSSDIASLKAYLHGLFTIKDLGETKCFLAVEIARGSTGNYLNQRKYIVDIFKDTVVLQWRPTPVPFPQGLKWTGKTGKPLPNPEQYRHLVGRLLYFNWTRADITYYFDSFDVYLISML